MSSRRRNSSKLDRFLAKHGLKKVRLLLQGKEVDAGEPCAEVELVAPPLGRADIAPWGGDTFDHNVYPPPSW